jgi:squalene cyclase
MTVHDSISQVPELAARVDNNQQYNIQILGVPSLVYPSFAATPLCIALSASLFLLSFASNSEKCNENKENETWVYRVMTRKQKKVVLSAEKARQSGRISKARW